MCNSRNTGKYNAVSEELLFILLWFNRPSFRNFYYDDVTEFEVDVVDTWEMKIESRRTCKGRFRIELPGREYMAIRVVKKLV